MIATFVAAMLIPPPPDWQPPHFVGPGLLCASRYGLDLLAGESATVDWPGEIFMRDLFSTFHVATPRGEVLITENGPTTRPQGNGRRAGRVGTHFIRDHGGGVYSVEVNNGAIRAVTLRFPASFGRAGQRAMLARLRIDPPPHPICLEADNRPRP
jgi:hypothetical protein